MIRAQLEALDTARINCDISAMVHLLRTSLSRDLGGMGNTDLYRHSYIGTKALVERYVKSAVQTIETVVDRTVHWGDMEARDLLQDMVYARQSFGRSALLLSGGATFGMSHIGVLKTLFEQKLLPRIISGASAGSIVCAVLCTRNDDEVPALIKAFPYGELQVFAGDKDDMWDHIRHLVHKGSWADIKHLVRAMRIWLGDMTFLEAYNRTRRICNICVSSASIYDVPRLINYVTAPNVIIWSAVAASCSVPLVFQGHPLLMKDPVTNEQVPWIPTPQQFIDGSVDNDLPMSRLAEMFNVNHFIVSQVNPHVVPFLAKDEHPTPGQRPGQTASRSRSWFWSLASYLKEEGLHKIHLLNEAGISPGILTKVVAVVNQKYSGDITIIPEVPPRDLVRMLANPTTDFMIRSCLIGERATWPKLSRVRDRLAIELALDRAVHALRAHVVFRKSQVDLRRALGAVTPLGYASPNHTSGLTPYMSAAFRVVQPTPSGATTPTEEHRPLGRRRGSAASVQLVVATRHKKPFMADADDSDDDDGERLEVAVRRSRGSTRGRLRRNARSHGQMRGGKPVVNEFLAPDGARLSASEVFWRTAERATAGESSTAAGTPATAPHDEDGSDMLSLEDFTPEVQLTPAEASASDGGLASDADPYAMTARHGSASPRREQPSKLRHSES